MRMAERFVIESMIHGYHEYKSIWDNPVNGEELNCVQEIGNAHDPTAVAVKNETDGETKTISHILRRISALFCIYKKRGYY